MTLAVPGLRYASGPGRWVIAATVLGSGIAALDATVVGIALPAIARDFHADNASIKWVVVGYLLSLAVWIPASGWMGDRFGTRRVLLTAIGIFTVGSALCATAWSEEDCGRSIPGCIQSPPVAIRFAWLCRVTNMTSPAGRPASSSRSMSPTAKNAACGPAAEEGRGIFQLGRSC